MKGRGKNGGEGGMENRRVVRERWTDLLAIVPVQSALFEAKRVSLQE